MYVHLGDAKHGNSDNNLMHFVTPYKVREKIV